MNSMNQNVSEHIVFTIMDADGNFVKAEVNKKNTFNDLRSKIQDVCGIPLQNQWFTCQDQRSSSNDNSVTATENKQEKEAFVDVNDNISINVETLNGEFMIKVNEKNSIENVMAKIKNEFNIPLNRQCFTCSDCKTLSDQFFFNEYQKLLNDNSEDVILAVENIVSNDTGKNDPEKEQEANSDQLVDKENGLTIQLTHSSNLKDTVDVDMFVDEEIEDEESGSSSENESEEFFSEESDGEESCYIVETIYALNKKHCIINEKYVEFVTIQQKSLFLKNILESVENCPLRPLIPKIYKCELNFMFVHNQSLTWKEYQLLTSSGTIQHLILHICIIKHDDGTTVTADKLFAHLPKLFKLNLRCSNYTSMFRSQTAKKIVRILLRSSVMTDFDLDGLTETFDISAFTDFVMKNRRIDICLGFKKGFSYDFKRKLKNFVEKIISNPPAIIPLIKFYGFNAMSQYKEYRKLYKDYL